jgi:hypothetical protein
MKYPDKYLKADVIIPVKSWTRDRLRSNIEDMQGVCGHNVTYDFLINNILDIYESANGVDHRHPRYQTYDNDVAEVTKYVRGVFSKILNSQPSQEDDRR